MRKTPYLLFALMRKLFAFTGGRSNDFFNKLISKKRPFVLSKSSYNGVLGDLNQDKIQSICRDIEDKGFHIFESRLSDSTVEKILNFAKRQEVEVVGLNKKGKMENFPGQPRYNILPQDIVGSDDLCKLITDESLKAVAGSYLDAEPICDLLAMWWSYPSDKYRSEAAQMYHFDMDRLKFLKFFFYLTDVTLETGPHCYIAGTHRLLPWKFRRDGRFTDEELVDFYGPERVQKLIGKKGTIMAVDTRGFHKGEPLTEGHRLIFQVEFCNSLFGMNYPPISRDRIHADFRDKFSSDPDTYLQIFSQ